MDRTGEFSTMIFDAATAITAGQQEAYKHGLAEGLRKAALNAKRYAYLAAQSADGGRVAIYILPAGADSDDWSRAIEIDDSAHLDRSVDDAIAGFDRYQADGP